MNIREVDSESAAATQSTYSKVTQSSEAIRWLPKNSTPFIIGIEGYGGAGKTTLANMLSDTLGNPYVINIDDFIVNRR